MSILQCKPHTHALVRHQYFSTPKSMCLHLIEDFSLFPPLLLVSSVFFYEVLHPYSLLQFAGYRCLLCLEEIHFMVHFVDVPCSTLDHKRMLVYKVNLIQNLKLLECCKQEWNTKFKCSFPAQLTGIMWESEVQFMVGWLYKPWKRKKASSLTFWESFYTGY